jgi:hypothetical protein
MSTNKTNPGLDRSNCSAHRHASSGFFYHWNPRNYELYVCEVREAVGRLQKARSVRNYPWHRVIRYKCKLGSSV